MIGRVTSQQLAYSAQQTISASKARLAVLQQQASSGVALTKPSDDPIGTAASMQTRSQIAANTQYGTNISDGLGWAGAADNALTSSEDLVRKAKDLTIQAGNTANMSSTAREAIAVQLDQIKSDLLSQANTTYLGRSVFAGNSDTAAFASDGSYSGTNGGTVQRRISASETVAVSADGGAAFGTPAVAASADGSTPAVASTSVFDAIDAVTTALRSSTYDTDTVSQAAVSNGINALQTSMDKLTDVHTVVGTNYSRLTTAKTQNGNDATTLENQRSGIEDVDTTKVLLDLKTQELAYQTALQVTATAIQPTLMSFLS